MGQKIFTRNGIAEVSLNRRKAIHLKCLDCSGFEQNEVRDCNYKDCSLLPYRTGQGKQDARKRNIAIKEYCMWCCVDQEAEINNCTSEYCPLWNFRGSLRQKLHIEALQDMISVEVSNTITEGVNYPVDHPC